MTCNEISRTSSTESSQTLEPWSWFEVCTLFYPEKVELRVFEHLCGWCMLCLRKSNILPHHTIPWSLKRFRALHHLFESVERSSRGRVAGGTWLWGWLHSACRKVYLETFRWSPARVAEEMPANLSSWPRGIDGKPSAQKEFLWIAQKSKLAQCLKSAMLIPTWSNSAVLEKPILWLYMAGSSLTHLNGNQKVDPVFCFLPLKTKAFCHLQNG